MKNKPAPASTPVSELSPGLRRYLYFTATITGGAIMIVEILGAKMLSPFVGTSHFVWTAQIAITMVALACGYYIGGGMADRSLRLGRLYGAILAAGLYLIVTVMVREPVAYWCLRFNLAIGSLLASAFLFFVPLCLMAMVGPFFIRVLSQSVTSVGGTAGRLTALSTLGSFAGTVLIGYVLIPLLPNSITMYITAVVLMLLAAGFFFGTRTTGRSRGVVAMLVLLGCGVGYFTANNERWRGTQMNELFRGNSNFGLLQVLHKNESPLRYYLNDYLFQNTYDTNEQKSSSMFTHMLHGLAKVYTPRTEDVFCIGMGVGIVPMEFAREGARVEVAEINPAVVPLAESYFDFDRSKMRLYLTDGRYILNKTTNRYDAVILDAFLGDSCPSHLMTREAFASIRRVLKPDGVLVINTFAEVDGARDFFGASLFKTLTNVFPGVVIHAGRNGNTLFVAGLKAEMKFVRQPDYSRVHPSLMDLVRDTYTRLVEPDPAHGIVLTDDYNPVEFHDAANREKTRRSLVGMMREMQEE